MSSVPNVIHFNCQSCGMLLTVPKELAGVTGPCPHCRVTITSPAASSPATLPGPSWPMAQNAAAAAPSESASPALQQPPAQQHPSPQRTPLPPPGGVEPPESTPSSTWEASNPPQASPLPPAVGGGVLNPAWPPAGTELPSPALPSPVSTHPVIDSVLQMPGVHPAQGPGQGLPPAQASPSFPPAPPPRTSPLAVPSAVAAAQRFKSSQSSSSSRKGPAVLALLMAMMVLAGTAWFFRDQLRVAWTTYTAAREAEAEALEFHPTPPAPDEPATPPAAFDPTRTPAPSHADSSPVPGAQPASAAASSGVASVGGDGAPVQPPAGAAVASPGVSSPTPAEQVQRPGMASNSINTQPDASSAPAPAPSVPGNQGSPPNATSAPAPAPNLVEVPSPVPPAPENAPATEPDSPKRSPALTPPTPSIADVPEEARPALKALTQFLTAPTWEDRLKVVQGAEVMKALMQSYYASMPDGPLHVAKIALIRHDKAPQTGPPHCVFQIGGGDVKRPLPIMVEHSPEGWKVDWLTFTEFKDNLLARFMESPQEGPKRFHVLVRRTHYFDDNVPEVDKKICVEVQAPTPPFVGSVFAKKGTPVANILDRYLGWEVDQAAAVVELEWRRDGDQQWVELTGLPQFNWRNAIAGEVIPPPNAAPTTPVAVPAR